LQVGVLGAGAAKPSGLGAGGGRRRPNQVPTAGPG